MAGENIYEDTLDQVAQTPTNAGAAPNPYSETLELQEATDEQHLRASFDQGAKQSPDRAAEIQRLSTRTGIPADVVDRNFEAIQDRARRVDTPYARMLKETPHLAEWAKEPSNVAVAHDDMENLGLLEWLVSAPQRAFAQTINQQRYAELRFKDLYAGGLTQEERDALESYRFHAQEGAALGAGQSWFRKAVLGTAQFLANQAPVTKYGIAGTVGGLVVGGTAAAFAAPELAVGTVVAGAASGAKYGGHAGVLYGVLESTLKSETAGAYDELQGFRDEHGRPLEPNVLKAAALAAGLINAPIEAGAQEFLLRSIPGLDKLSALGVRAGVADALRTPTVRAALGELVRSYGETLTAETAQEVAQRAVTILSGELAKKVSGDAGGAPIPGQLEPGNVDLYRQPKVGNADGTVSTVDSVSVNIDGKEILIPRVTPDGRHLDTPAAIEEYKRTGRHLGVFDSPQAADAFAQQLHEDYANGTYDQPGKYRTAGQIGSDLLQEGTGAATSFALGLLPGPLMGAVMHVNEARRARHSQAIFQAIGEAAKNSKTIERLPEAAQDFIERATKDGPIPTVYAPVDTWTRYWQAQGEDPAAMAARVTGDKDALEKAQQTGVDLAIPTARYAVTIAPTEHNEYFSRELRLGPDEMNGREADQFAELVKQQAQAAPAAAEATGTSQVRAQILEQLQRAGVPQATAEQYAGLYESAFGSMASRAGLDASQLFESYGLKVERPALQEQGLENKPVASEAAPLGTAVPAAEETAPLPLDSHTEEIPGLADLEASLGGASIEQVDAGAEQNNASGDSAASLEATSRQQGMADRGESFVVYDRAGRVRTLVGPEAVDYQARPGETYGVQGPRGLQVLEDHGGKVPAGARWGSVDMAAPAAQTEEANAGRATEAGAELSDRARQQPSVDTGGVSERPGDGGSPELRRLPSALSYGDNRFERQPADVNAQRLTPEIVRELERIAEELDALPFVPRSWSWLPPDQLADGNAAGGKANIVAGAPGAKVYDNILEFAPVNLVARGKRKGQLQQIKATRSQVYDAVAAVLKNNDIRKPLEEGAVRVAERRAANDYSEIDRPQLPPWWGVEAPQAFTDELSASIDDALNPPTDLLDPDAHEEAILEPEGPVDTSFNVEEFNQSLFDAAEGPDEHIERFAASRTDLKRTAGPANARKAQLEQLATDEAMGVEFPENQPSHFPDGSDAVVCTNCALRILQLAGGGEIYGWEEGTNPTSIVAGPSMGAQLDDGQGHDFAVVDGRYLVDAWAKNVEGSSDRAVFDLTDASDRAEVLRLFGDPRTWVKGNVTGEGDNLHVDGFEPGHPVALDLPPVDALDTGEGQQRLPGDVGDVRDQEVPTPAEDLPFALTAPTPASRKGKQTTLFQSAYHGSPHVFERFDLQHLGSGEGNQAYGWGLYFASKREIAEFYRNVLTDDPVPAFTALSKEENDSIPNWVRVGIHNALTNGLLENPFEYYIDEFKARTNEARKRIIGSTPEEVAQDIENGWGTINAPHPQPHLLEEQIESHQRTIAALEKLEAAADKGAETKRGGRIYKVEIPDEVHMLDWDKTASQQSPQVQQALAALGIQWAPFKTKSVKQMLNWFDGPTAAALMREDIGIRQSIMEGRQIALENDAEGLQRWQLQHQGYFNAGMTDPSGEHIYGQVQHLAERREIDRSVAAGAQSFVPMSRRKAAEAASKMLLEQGIPGIRYLDGASRRAGEGDRNYVIFDDRLVQIQEFYQSGTITPESLDAWTEDLRHRVGPDLAYLQLRLTKAGDLVLENLAVKRGAARAGLGTRVMQEITRFADLNGRRILLSPAEKGHSPVAGAERTTSSSRLERFYRRFGFVRNIGGLMDPAIGESMYREPTVPASAPPMPVPAKPAERLIIQHNLRADRVLAAVKRGGLAVPSLAITTADDAMTNFGEITLLGRKEMAVPGPSTRVFASDVYSPRYPTIHFKLDKAAEKQLGALVKKFKDQTGQTYLDLDEIQQNGERELKNVPAVLADFLESKGIALPAPVLDEGKYARPGQIDTFRTRYEMESIIREKGLGEEFDAHVAQLFASLKPEERIFKGFTNQGNRAYQPHTLENVVKLLKRNLRGGETSGNIYGIGQLRAKFTPEFRSLAGIRAAAKRITTKAEFDEIKGRLDAEVFQLGNDLKPYYEHGDTERFGFIDTVLAVLEESARKSIHGSLVEYGFKDVPADIQARLRAFLDTLRAFPTEYFEAKITRAVSLSEFRAAVVPTDTRPEVLEALRNAGIEEIATYDKTDTGDGGATARKAAVAELADKLGSDVLFQDEPAGKRGAIRFGPDRQFNIRLFERADLSTFLHETGHFFLEVFGDLAERVHAIDPAARTSQQEGLLRDYASMLEWLKVPDRGAITVEHHEQFARGFEAYLMSGQAPSVQLRGTFARFRAWLISIYKNVRNLHVDLTPEVTKVMDRLVASDTAIAEAEAQRNVQGLFTSPESAGMTAKEFDLYRGHLESAARTAREQLDAKLMAEVAREQTRAWRERRNEIQTDVENEYYAKRAYRAIAAMQRGTHPNGEGLVEGLETPPLKISRAQIVAQFGEERLKTLPKPAVYSVDGGMNPATVADMFGYTSADEMLTEIATVPPLRQAIRGEVTKRMIQEYGSIMLDGSLHDQAQTAIANEDREIVLRAELKALGKLRRLVAPFISQEREKVKANDKERAYERRWLEAEAKLRVAIAEGKKQVEIDALRGEVMNLRAKARGGAATINRAIPPANVIRDAAAQRLATMKVGEIRPSVYWSASRRAAQQALERAARQDFDGAIAAKQQELINLQLYRQAETLLEDIDQRVRFAKDLSKPANRKTLVLAGENYTDQVDAILDRFDFAPATKKVLERRASLVKFVEGLESQNIPADLPPELLDEALRKHYSQLTTEELIGVTDGLKQIMGLARLKLRLLKAQDAREFAAVRDGIVTSIEASAAPRPTQLEILPKDRAARMVGEWFASHTKLANMVARLDGYVDGGPLWSAMMRPINEAATAQATMHEQAGQAFRQILTSHYKGTELAHFHDQQFIPAINASLSKEARLAVALNWGNEGNRQRLMENMRGWKEPQVQAILDTLDARDLAFVQATLDHINSYWPLIAAKQERVFGVAPAKVEAAPWTHSTHGEQKGGYYPIAYDGRLSVRQGNIIDADVQNLQKHANYAYATTKRGYTETRQAKVNAPVRLELSVAYEHVEAVIHDLTHHEMLIDVGRLMADRQIQKAIQSRAGDITYKQMRGALLDIALGTRHSSQMADRAMNYLRNGTTIAGLGFNFWTASQQWLGVFNGAARIGPGWVAKGVVRMFRDASSMESTAKWIYEKSEMMRHRGSTASRELSDLRSSLRRSGSWFDNALRTVTADTVQQEDITNSYLWIIEKGQQLADMPVWVGAYERYLAEHPTDEKLAIALADQAVLDSQSGGQIKDLAQVQRGGPMFKLFTTFYSYGNLILNQTERTIGQTNFRQVGSVGTMMANLLLIYAAPAAITVALRRAFGNDGDDSFAVLFGRELLATAMNTMVLVRELGGAVQAAYDAKVGRPGPGGARGYEGPTGLRIFSAAGNLIGQVEQGKADRGLLKATEDVAGILFHFPVAQIQRSIDGFAALQEGRTHNPAALLVGPPKKKAGR